MNKYWNNPHGANFSASGGPAKKPGSPPRGGTPSKTANWPGVPGKTQGKARNAGSPKTGHKGPFYVKAEGL